MSISSAEMKLFQALWFIFFAFYSLLHRSYLMRAQQALLLLPIEWALNSICFQCYGILPCLLMCVSFYSNVKERYESKVRNTLLEWSRNMPLSPHLCLRHRRIHSLWIFMLCMCELPWIFSPKQRRWNTTEWRSDFKINKMRFVSVSDSPSLCFPIRCWEVNGCCFNWANKSSYVAVFYLTTW